MTVELHPVGVVELEKRLQEFEDQYHMPSNEFVLAFSNGHLDETEDFLDWSTLFSAWRIASRTQ